jgi:WD40 repeat protein
LELGGGDEDGIWTSAFVASPTGHLLAVVEEFPLRLRLGDLQTGCWVRTFKGVEDEAHRLAFSPDGKTLISGHENGRVVFWAVPSGRRLLTLDTLGYGINSLAFSPDGTTLAVGDGQGMVRLWPWRRLLEA